MVHNLNKRKPTRTVKKPSAAKQLAQQKADFTAEGSPPSGLVGTETPVTTDPAVVPADSKR